MQLFLCWVILSAYNLVNPHNIGISDGQGEDASLVKWRRRGRLRVIRRFGQKLFGKKRPKQLLRPNHRNIDSKAQFESPKCLHLEPQNTCQKQSFANCNSLFKLIFVWKYFGTFILNHKFPLRKCFTAETSSAAFLSIHPN